MKRNGGKIIVMVTLSLLVAIATLVGAAVIADINSNDFPFDLPDNNYSADISSDILQNSQQQTDVGSREDDTSSQENSSDAQSGTDQNIINAQTGIYLFNDDSIVITLSDAGFIEGNINCGGITMEFSGQMVGNTLVSTGTDSLNNTVEITLVFESNIITATSKPIIQYEEASDYLKLSGDFIK